MTNNQILTLISDIVQEVDYDIWNKPELYEFITLEDFIERLQVLWEQRIIDGDLSHDEINTIGQFVQWCIHQTKQDMDAPRNPDGLSLRMRAKELVLTK